MPTFDWKEYLDFAKTCGTISAVSSHCLDRVAASRVYYGFFGRARRYLIDHLHDPNFKTDGSEGFILKTNVHSYIPDAFRKEINPVAQEFADWLSDLRVWRNTADYDSRNGQVDASKFWAAAHKAEELLSKL